MKIFLITITMSLILACDQTSKVENQPSRERELWFFWSVDWHPQKELLSVGGMQDTLRIISSNDLNLIKSYPYKGTITKTKWHPSKNKLAVSVQDGKSKSAILNVDNDQILELDNLTMDEARAIGWNSTGALLAVGDYEGFLTIFDENGKLIRKVNTQEKSIIGLDWHPSENLIVAVGEKITMYNYNDDRLKQIEDREKEVLMLCVDWHPSGEFFVTGDYGDFEFHYPPLLQYWNYDGYRIKSIEESKAEYRNIEWSKDGTLLATASEKVRLWDDRGNLVKEANSESLLWGIDWNESSNHLAVTDEDGNCIIFNKDLNKVKQLQQ